MAAKKKQTFEEQMAEVERVIARMEGGGLALEDLLRDYENGMRLLTSLEKELQDAQQRLTVLRRGADGELTEEPLEVDE